VVREVITRTASFLTKDLEQLFGASKKVKRLEFKVIKICSVIEGGKSTISTSHYSTGDNKLIDASRHNRSFYCDGSAIPEIFCIPDRLQPNRILSKNIRIRIRILTNTDIQIWIFSDTDTDTDIFLTDTDMDTV
jgi:hypothetical protein